MHGSDVCSALACQGAVRAYHSVNRPFHQHRGKRSSRAKPVAVDFRIIVQDATQADKTLRVHGIHSQGYGTDRSSPLGPRLRRWHEHSQVQVGAYIPTNKLGHHLRLSRCEAEALLQCEPGLIILAYSDMVVQADQHMQIPLGLRKIVHRVAANKGHIDVKSGG
jgi:hypothetical protein